MSPEQKALVKETWRKVVPMADAAARLFYDRLFEIDPTTPPLVKTIDLADQRRKLIQALTVVVQGLDHLEAFVPMIANLGRRYSQFGVIDATMIPLARLGSGRSSKGLDRTGRLR
jgi:hemoglobin-like flavoprotein